jgi:hypothetical protein
VSPVKYELGFYIPEDDILHSHRRGNLKSYIQRHNPQYSTKSTPCFQFRTHSSYNMYVLWSVEDDEVGGTCGTNGREEERV